MHTVGSYLSSNSLEDCYIFSHCSFLSWIQLSWFDFHFAAQLFDSICCSKENSGRSEAVIFAMNCFFTWHYSGFTNGHLGHGDPSCLSAWLSEECTFFDSLKMIFIVNFDLKSLNLVIFFEEFETKMAAHFFYQNWFGLYIWSLDYFPKFLEYCEAFWLEIISSHDLEQSPRAPLGC